MDLALSVTMGSDFLGTFKVAGGPVLYIDRENGDNLLARRFSKLAAARQLASDGLPLQVLRLSPVSFTEPDQLQWLIDRVLEHGAKLLVVDSLIRVHDAEENSATEMSRVFMGIKAVVDATGCSVVLIDHTRKLQQGQPGADHVVRGSSDKEAFADSVLIAKRRDDELHVEHRKSRYDQAREPFVVKIVDISENKTSLSMQGNVAELQEAREQSAAESFLDQFLPESDWISKTDLEDKARESKVSIRALRKVIKVRLINGTIDEKREKQKKGRGGKTVFFRLAPQSQDGENVNVPNKTVDFNMIDENNSEEV